MRNVRTNRVVSSGADVQLSSSPWRERVLSALRTLILVGLLATAWLVLRGWAGAQDDGAGASYRARRDRADLVLALARVAYNEAGDNEPDLALIWAATRAHGETDRARLGFLYRHSPCATAQLPDSIAYQRPGRCRWTRNLDHRGQQPRGWIPSRDGRWTSRDRDRWLAHLERAGEFVRGERVLDVCPETPWTWDGRRWIAERVAEGRRPLGCTGTLNEGYAR